MSIAAIDEQIRLYAKQLKIPTFAEYEQVLRQADPNLGLSELLLELMKNLITAKDALQMNPSGKPIPPEVEGSRISIPEISGRIRLFSAQRIRIPGVPG